MRTSKEDQIVDEVERTLHSFDHDVVLEGNPFLASRIKAERDSRLYRRKRGFTLKLGLNQAVMLALLLINLITMAYYYEWNTEHNLQERLVAELKEDFLMDQFQSSF